MFDPEWGTVFPFNGNVDNKAKKVATKSPHSTIIATVYLGKGGPKMFLLFSHLIDEKFASFFAYLKSWLKVVLVFGKEHANLSNINGVMIGQS